MSLDDRMRHVDPVEERLLLRVEEAAALLGVGRTTVYAMVSTQKLPVVRIGRSLRIPRQALLQWIRDRVDGEAYDSEADPPVYAMPRVRDAFKPRPPRSRS